MRTPIISLLLLILFLPVHAQNPAASRQRTPPVQRANRERPPVETPKPLEENHVIRLSGSFNGQKIELSLTGIGPLFASDQILSDDDTAFTCEYVLSKQGEKFKIDYSIGTRVKVLSSTSGDSKNFQYRDVMIRGSILATLGKQVIISKSQSDTLKLSVELPPQPAQGGH